jgi:hypothetical protein
MVLKTDKEMAVTLTIKTPAGAGIKTLLPSNQTKCAVDAKEPVSNL